MQESNRIEFKEILNDGLEKEVIAFLNYHGGGVVYIGIRKDGVAVGLKDIDSDMLKIKDRLKGNIQPSCLGLFDIASEVKGEVEVIKITVASGSEKPYYLRKYGMTEKGAFIRIGTSAEQMPVRMIEELFSKRTRNSISKIKSNVQELKFEQLKIYYQSSGKALKEQFAKNLELLTEEGKLNYVAYLLADQNNNSIKVAKYQGVDRVNLIESNEYGLESLIKATKQVLDKVELENKTLTEITSKERKEQRKWNAIALREAIINAFVHNDYSKEVFPKFEFFDDRIEISSAGGLPEGLSQEEFFEGFSVPRNKELMRVYKDVDLVEQLGSGVPRILAFYPKECFKFSDNFLRMTFPSEGSNQGSNQDDFLNEFKELSELLVATPEENMDYLWGKNESFVAYLNSTFGITSGKLRESFGITSGKKIDKSIITFQLLVIFPTITSEEIGKSIGVSSRSAETYIKKIREAGLIEREGGRKEGYWQITKQA
jgi:ATP-dependent DNA helicase RecG